MLLVIAGTAAFFLRDALAIFSEKSAVKYKEYASSHTVEDSTLFVGTYLIHINAVTDELYAQAQNSGSEANQNSIYYKSELAGGAWFDITDAEGLNDIMDSGTAISDDEIGDLYIAIEKSNESIRSYIADVAEKLEAISDGDLTAQVTMDYIGDFEELKTSINKISESLNTSMQTILRGLSETEKFRKGRHLKGRCI